MPLRLKKSSGWFAAGQEVAKALEILSDAAFKLYVYVCLRAERRSARIVCQPSAWAIALQCEPHRIADSLEELYHRQICKQAPAAAGWVVEICDRFWPYEKVPTRQDPGIKEADYIRQVRQIFLRPACVRASFSAADEHCAATLYRDGVSLVQIQRAVHLGCARKYMALLRGDNPALTLVTPLSYFAAIVDEVTAAAAGEDYWRYVASKAAQFERRWVEFGNGKKVH
jgi:hypothetical protein